MAYSALSTVDDSALAEAMVRVWGQEAALKASDNACTQAFMGNEDAAQKWRRVMVLVAAVSKAGEILQDSPSRAVTPTVS
jgi:hypothetical protein